MTLNLKLFKVQITEGAASVGCCSFGFFCNWQSQLDMESKITDSYHWKI